MKRIGYIVTALLVLVFIGCGSHKDVTTDSAVDNVTFVGSDFLKKVTAQNVSRQYLTSKLKFSAQMGSQKVSVNGSLKMKRDAVIRIQLTALGLMEVGRLEFTPDYVLIMDRVHKQYIKAPYAHVDFLQRSGINFYTLQALFWNELFQPGHKTPNLKNFAVVSHDNEVLIDLEGDNTRLDYQWNAQRKTALITQAQVSHSDALFRWTYDEFKKFDKRPFPNDMQVNISSKEKSMSLGFKLSSLSDDDDWETYTKVSSRYTQVTVDDILQKILSL